MVASSDGGFMQHRSILHKVKCGKLFLRNECLPVLIGICKLQSSKTGKSDDTSNRISQFILKSQKCPDIELYWTQAIKLLSGSKLVVSRSCTSFEAARVTDRFWMVYHDLTFIDAGPPDEKWRLKNVFNERSYLTVLNSIIPIIVSCFRRSEVSQLIKVIVASTLAIDHLSNLAVNLPSLCSTISEVLLSYLRNAQDAALVWKYSRVLLSIASKDRELAICVRDSMVRKREHPLLCLEITNRFVHDADRFIDTELCSPTSPHNSSKISSSWLINNLRDCDLLLISKMTVSRLNLLITERLSSTEQELINKTVGETRIGTSPTDSGSQFRQRWRKDIIRCARVISACSCIRGSFNIDRPSSSSSLTSSPDFYGKIDVLETSARALITAAEGSLAQFESISNEDKKSEVEVMLRIAIMLLLVGFTVSATAFILVRGDSAQNQNQNLEKSKLLEREGKLASLLISARKAQSRLIEMECTILAGSTVGAPDTAAEAARTHMLFLAIAVTFGCCKAVRSLSNELNLGHFIDFMTEIELIRVLLILGKILIVPGGERNRNSILRLQRLLDYYFDEHCTARTLPVIHCEHILINHLSTTESQFSALREPMSISASNEQAGDWTSCLSLMLSCGLMTLYNNTIEAKADVDDPTEAGPDVNIVKKKINHGIKMNSAAISCNATHSLMVRVLSNARWPPHTQIKSCIDEWLAKCTGVISSITSLSATASGGNDKKQHSGLGLPLLLNEVYALCKISCRQESGIHHMYALDYINKKEPLNLACDVCHKRIARCNNTKLRAEKTRDVFLEITESHFSDFVLSLLQSWGGLERVDGPITYPLNKDGDSDDENDGDSDDDSNCICAPPPSNSLISSSSSSIAMQEPLESSCTSEGDGLRGVLSCYAALHYASLSMQVEEIAGVSTSSSLSRAAEIIYRGPFVCDLRSLPIKTAVQYLLHKIREIRYSGASSSFLTPSTSSSSSSSLTEGCIILNSFVKLVLESCPELLLLERSECYRMVSISPLSSSTITTSVHDKNHMDSILLNCDQRRSEVLLDYLIGLTDSSKGVKATPTQYSMGCSLIADASSFFLNFFCQSPLMIVSDRLIQNVLVKAFDNKEDRQVSAGLWSIWTAVHTYHPYPQEVEISSLNCLLSGRILDFHSRVFTSYEQLLQEPLFLFTLPHSVLSELFTLRLVVFITRSALCASRCAVRTALRLKHKVAEAFLTADLRHRSVTESSLYLHEQTYIDLQELMAARLVLGLWETWGEEDTAGSRRLVLIDFLAALISDNSHLVGLLLCHQLTPRSFELLMSCSTAVAVALGSCHLEELRSTTLALKTLPPQSALSIDPSITSSSLQYTAAVTAASNLATDSEISPEYVERLLLHSLCLLKMSKHTDSERFSRRDKKGENGIFSIHCLAESLPSFVLSSTNSLNVHLTSKQIKPIELYSTAIVSQIYSHHPTCVTPFKQFINSTEKLITANTAAVALALKVSGGKGHVRDDDSVYGSRPAVVALKSIIKRIDLSHYPPQRDSLTASTDEASQSQQYVPSVLSSTGGIGGVVGGGGVLHKTSRPQDETEGTSDECSVRKKVRSATQSSE